jgi:cell division protein FtsL
MYTRLQQHEGQRWYLEEEYSRLLLEQSTWASHHRIAIEAADSLGLAAPDLPRTRLVQP